PRRGRRSSTPSAVAHRLWRPPCANPPACHGWRASRVCGRLGRIAATTSPIDRLARAEEAVRLAQADARAARRLAATVGGDDEAGAVAERALGLAAVELGRLDEAVAHLRRAVALASAAAMDRRVAEARMSLSLALTLQGATTEALAEADRAA